MKILVVGKGGREHALISALLASPGNVSIYSFPGSDAIFDLAQPLPSEDGPLDSVSSLVSAMQREGIDLCVAGEESYLVREEGLANACQIAGIPCWGPPKEAAQLEASKEFAKEFMLRHAIPTGGYHAVDTVEAALNAIDEQYPTVLKFDGLAAGKGVAICPDRESAEEFLNEVLKERKFGDGRLLVEEYLEGPEISIFVSVVDHDFQILAPARDYKRIFNDDQGPNTGGMGAVSSWEMIAPDLMKLIEETIVRPTVAGLVTDGLPYRGFLYFGLMLTQNGPKVLEYNCRFGDPEAEAVLPMIRGDFAAYLQEAARGSLCPDLISIAEGWGVCVVSASAGYPASSRTGDLISGMETVAGAQVFHAGTRRNAQGDFETAGGRVLVVSATDSSREKAVARVYAECEKIHFDGMQRRSDIGVKNF